MIMWRYLTKSSKYFFKNEHKNGFKRKKRKEDPAVISLQNDKVEEGTKIYEEGIQYICQDKSIYVHWRKQNKIIYECATNEIFKIIINETIKMSSWWRLSEWSSSVKSKILSVRWKSPHKINMQTLLKVFQWSVRTH